MQATRSKSALSQPYAQTRARDSQIGDNLPLGKLSDSTSATAFHFNRSTRSRDQ